MSVVQREPSRASAMAQKMSVGGKVKGWYGDPRTSGRLERASERNKRKRRERLDRVRFFHRDTGWLTVKEMAQALGRGQTYVKDHASELGGVKVDNDRLGVNTPGSSWRFPPRYRAHGVDPVGG